MMRIKIKKSSVREKVDTLAGQSVNPVWCMHFMLDQLWKDRSFRPSSVMDEFNGEEIALEVDFSLLPERVVPQLKQNIWRCALWMRCCDNCLESVCHRLQAWVERRGIRLEGIRCGKPQQDA